MASVGLRVGPHLCLKLCPKFQNKNWQPNTIVLDCQLHDMARSATAEQGTLRLGQVDQCCVVCPYAFLTVIASLTLPPLHNEVNTPHKSTPSRKSK